MKISFNWKRKPKFYTDSLFIQYFKKNNSYAQFIYDVLQNSYIPEILSCITNEKRKTKHKQNIEYLHNIRWIYKLNIIFISHKYFTLARCYNNRKIRILNIFWQLNWLCPFWFWSISSMVLPDRLCSGKTVQKTCFYVDFVIDNRNFCFDHYRISSTFHQKVIQDIL